MYNRFFVTRNTYYLDAAATTPVSSRALRAMSPYWSLDFYNPHAIYSDALRVRNHLALITTNTLRLLNAHKGDQVFWTKGGTESNQLALDAVITDWYKTHSEEKGTIITSAIEHSSISDFLAYKQYPNINLVTIPVDSTGRVELERYEALLCEIHNPIMVSVVFQSSEIGRIQPIKEITALTRAVCAKNGTKVPVIHTDMSQGSYTHMPNAQNLGIDMLTLCGQKIEGPKGVGVLYMREKYKKIIPTGGTPAVALIVGMYTQLEYLGAHREQYSMYVRETRKQLLKALTDKGVQYVCNGYEGELSHILNITLTEYPADSEALIVACDKYGLQVSSKSACMSSQKEDSRVLEAMGIHPKNSLRISFIPSLGRAQLGTRDAQEIARRIKKIISH